jgi:hypothetical protein
MLIADLFLRTYPKDYKWLPYLFRSLERHATDWRNLVIVFPFEGTPEGFKVALAELEAAVPLKEWGTRLRKGRTITGKIEVHTCRKEFRDDYIGQCVTKLHAWEYSDADSVCFLDSDLVFVKNFNPLTLHGGPDFLRPTIEIREWGEAGDALKVWFEITRKLLHGESPPYETMCRHPFQYPTQFIRRAWNALKDVPIMDGTHISEFNYLGNYAMLHEPHNFNFERPAQLHKENGSGTPDHCDSDLVFQFWSHDGPESPKVQEKLRELGYLEDLK